MENFDPLNLLTETSKRSAKTFCCSSRSSADVNSSASSANLELAAVEECFDPLKLLTRSAKSDANSSTSSANLELSAVKFVDEQASSITGLDLANSKLNIEKLLDLDCQVRQAEKDMLLVKEKWSFITEHVDSLKDEMKDFSLELERAKEKLGYYAWIKRSLEEDVTSVPNEKFLPQYAWIKSSLEEDVTSVPNEKFLPQYAWIKSSLEEDVTSVPNEKFLPQWISPKDTFHRDITVFRVQLRVDTKFKFLAVTMLTGLILKIMMDKMSRIPRIRFILKLDVWCFYLGRTTERRIKYVGFRQLKGQVQVASFFSYEHLEELVIQFSAPRMLGHMPPLSLLHYVRTDGRYIGPRGQCIPPPNRPWSHNTLSFSEIYDEITAARIFAFFDEELESFLKP